VSRLAAVACLLALALLGCAAQAPGGHGSPALRVLGVENFYADVAAQIGGAKVHVDSILSDPSVDPHVYESSVEDAKLVAQADVVIENGAGYDAFVDRLLAASPRADRIVINVAQLTGHHQGDNPHLWYDSLNTMPPLARALARALSQKDPADQPAFASGAQAFVDALEPIRQLDATISQKYAGAPALATEPLWNYAAAAAGLSVLDADGPFQKATEDGNDPPASAVVRFRGQLTSRAARLLVVNSQAVTPMAQQMQALARQNGVPVVAMSETEPPNTTYQQWMAGQLQAVLQALGG
jgi:zinc/manganese transport system substrate-binding protein